MANPYKKQELLFINHEVDLGLAKVKYVSLYKALYIGKHEGRPCYMVRNGSKLEFYYLTAPPNWKEAKPWSVEAAQAARGISNGQMLSLLQKTKGPEVTIKRERRRKRKKDHDLTESDSNLATPGQHSDQGDDASGQAPEANGETLPDGE